jgi:isochorismate hydrolase
MQHHRNLRIPDTLADVCDRDRIALIVYDMQVGVVRQLADGPQVTERVRSVLEAARRAELRIFFTRHMTLPTELMGIAQLRTWMAWQHKDRVEDVVSPFLRDSPAFQIVPELAPLPSEAVFDKLSMSPFEGTPLEFALRDTQVTAFAIVGVVIRACLLANGGLFADGHTHPWFTTPLFKSRAGRPLAWVGQRSRRAFAPFFRPVFARSYRLAAAEVEQAYEAISRRDGVRVLPATAGFVDEHREHAARWNLARIAAELEQAVRFHVVGCSEDRFEARQLRLARERLGDRVESTELPGGHLATAEQPGRLAELIVGIR